MGEISMGKSSRAEKYDFGNEDDDKNIRPDPAKTKKKKEKKEKTLQALNS